MESRAVHVVRLAVARSLELSYGNEYSTASQLTFGRRVGGMRGGGLIHYALDSLDVSEFSNLRVIYADLLDLCKKIRDQACARLGADCLCRNRECAPSGAIVGSGGAPARAS